MFSLFLYLIFSFPALLKEQRLHWSVSVLTTSISVGSSKLIIYYALRLIISILAVFAHRPDPTVPMEEVVRAFNWVIEKGYAFYWATSE
jgi:hypothetical protein